VLGLHALGPGVEVDHAGAWQLLASGRAAQHLGTAPQPLEPFLGDHLRDPGAIQWHALPTEHQRDLVDRVTRRAQFNDPGVRALLERRALGSRARGDEELAAPSAEVTHNRVERLGRVPKRGGDLGGRTALQQVRAQRLVAPLRRVGRLGEELTTRARLGRSR
jgi:hypothetical protein